MNSGELEEFEDLDENTKNSIIKFNDYLSSLGGGFFDTEELLEIIDYYFSIEDNEKLGKAIELSLSLYPNDTEIIVRNAQYIALIKNYVEAIDYLHQYEILLPHDTDILFALGILYSQAGDSEKSIQTLKHCAENEEDLEVFLALGQELMINGEHDEAVKIFERTLAIEPTNETALQSLTFCSQFASDTDNHIKFLKQLCLNNPYSVQNWLTYGLMLYQNENYFDAITALDLCIAIDEKNFTAHLYKGQSQISLENFQEGIATLHEAIKLTQDEPIIYFTLGQAYEKQNNWTTAAIYYKECIKRDKNNYDAWMGVGMCYFELNDFASAEPYVKQALELDPSNVHYRLAYAEMLYKENRIEEGEEMYQTLYDEGFELAIVTVNWALMMAENNRSMDAIHLLQETIEKYNFEEPQIHLALIELSSREPYLQKYVSEYLFQFLLNNDVTYDILKQNCPSILENPEYESLIKTYINE